MRLEENISDFRDVRIGTRGIEVEYRDDGAIIVKPDVEPIENYPRCLTDRLEYWADKTPDQVLVARRDEDGNWRKLSYAQVLGSVKKIAQNLLQRDLSQERPIVILSGNSIEHLLMALAAMYVGIPYAPISPAYSLVSTDYAKLKHILDLLTPGLVMVDEGAKFAKAITATLRDDCEYVAVDTGGIDVAVTAFESLQQADDTAEVEDANQAITSDTIAKFLFTSGSTSMPKGVINTQRMLCVNQAMIQSTFQFLADEPPVLVDWLPWNHTFGGNHNVGIVIHNGGSLYIDDGKPAPGLIEQTIRNLKEISTNIYFNVPKGFEILAQRIAEDDELRETFFKDLKILFFAGAGMSQHVWDALDEQAIRTLGKKVAMLSGWGATETAPSALFTFIEGCRSGVVGTPLPGVTMKLVPVDEKLELRVAAPSVTPGYWRQEDTTRKAFDEEGFYCTGDALKFIDATDPQRGFAFDGRIQEDFKLDSGTWVSVGALRPKVILHCAPYVKDVVITGHDRSYVGALVFVDYESCRRLANLPEGVSLTEVTNHPKVRETFQSFLNELAAEGSGSSNRIRRLVLLDQEAQIDAHEITDKGSINQRAVLTNRADIVDDMYSSEPSPRVLLI
ncbi:MAG: feruloyl-CoA synthase [Gammaproteobacteria bacterium]|nr:feruloyl-CoA synthase [Gammaproteobacteria bacterium]